MILNVKGLSVRYIVGDLREIGLKEYILKKLKRTYEAREFNALYDVSFSIEEGEILGVIGVNGSGKSTLLKAVSGIIEPTTGTIERKGVSTALLELSSGFDMELTVKENTFLRGAILGYSREFMKESYEEILSFSELDEYEHRLFKQLSTGMKARLAFSIATQSSPNILIIDEVLAVGDGAFRKKSEERIEEMIARGVATIMVSHQLNQIRRLCTKVLWLHKGSQMFFGDTEEACDRYQEFLLEKAKK